MISIAIAINNEWKDNSNEDEMLAHNYDWATANNRSNHNSINNTEKPLQRKGNHFVFIAQFTILHHVIGAFTNEQWCAVMKSANVGSNAEHRQPFFMEALIQPDISWFAETLWTAFVVNFPKTNWVFPGTIHQSHVNGHHDIWHCRKKLYDFLRNFRWQ